MRKYIGPGIYVVGLVVALCAGAFLNGTFSHVSAAAANSDYTIVSRTSSTWTSATPRLESVTCPTGKVVVGGGGSVLQPGGGVSLNGGILVQSEPERQFGWVVSGVIPASSKGPSSFRVRAFAICATR